MPEEKRKLPIREKKSQSETPRIDLREVASEEDMQALLAGLKEME